MWAILCLYNLFFLSLSRYVWVCISLKLSVCSFLCTCSAQWIALYDISFRWTIPFVAYSPMALALAEFICLFVCHCSDDRSISPFNKSTCKIIALHEHTCIMGKPKGHMWWYLLLLLFLFVSGSCVICVLKMRITRQLLICTVQQEGTNQHGKQ